MRRPTTTARHVWPALVGALLLAISAPAMAGPSGLTGWQEITVLTVSKLDHAVASCGFQLGWRQVSVLLDSAGLTMDSAHHHPRGPDLQRQIDEDAAAYQTDRVRACAQAWATFGADADARDFLTR